jgi:hypothetical protein
MFLNVVFRLWCIWRIDCDDLVEYFWIFCNVPVVFLDYLINSCLSCCNFFLMLEMFADIWIFIVEIAWFVMSFFLFSDRFHTDNAGRTQTQTDRKDV